jgi:hypothetical protein
VQALHARQRDQYAQRAVVAPGVADRVEVRAEQERPRRRAARRLPAAEHVADRVAPRVHPGLAHPRHDDLAGLRERRRGEAARQAPGLLGALREAVGAGEDRGGERRRGGGRCLGARHRFRSAESHVRDARATVAAGAAGGQAAAGRRARR